MQARVAASQPLGLELLDGFNGGRGQQVDVIIDPGQELESVEQHRRGAPQQGGGLARHDAPVGQLDRRGRLAGGLSHLQRGPHDGAVLLAHPHLGHEQRDPLGLDGGDDLALLGHQGPVVAADDLLAGGLPAGIIIADAVAGHVDTHVRRRGVGRGAQDLLEQAAQDREDLDVAVVVDGLDAVGSQVEGVDHVDVVEVGGGGLVGDVDRVVQRQVPDREGLELRVARGDAPLVVVVDLGQAGGHLAAARAGGGDDHQVPPGLNVLVAPVALRRDDAGDVTGVAGDGEVTVDRDAQRLELALEVLGLTVVISPLGHDDAAHVEPVAAEGVDVAQQVVLVGDAQVRADLVAGEVLGVDRHDDLDLVGQLGEHDDLVVRSEARQHARGVHVVNELAAELQIELAAELGAALRDVAGLHPQVLVAVESDAQWALLEAV